MSQQCALGARRAHCVLRCIEDSIASWLTEVIVPIYTGLAPHQVLCAVLGASIYKGHQTIRVCPEEGDQDGERPGVPDLQEVAEVAWLVQFGEEKAEGGTSSQSTASSRGAVEEEVLISSLR